MIFSIFLQESMLTKLQSNVEQEESVWKDRLNSKDNEIGDLRKEKDDLAKKNTALEESLKVVQQAEEVKWEKTMAKSAKIETKRELEW